VWVFPKIASYARAARISAAKVGLAGDHSTVAAIDRAQSPSCPVVLVPSRTGAKSYWCQVVLVPSRTGAKSYWWDWLTRGPEAGQLRVRRAAPGAPGGCGCAGRLRVRRAAPGAPGGFGCAGQHRVSR
jgi:hypothetical protein